MRTGNERDIPFTYGGMNWIAYIPDQTIRKDEYVWLDGPFCSQCNMKLKFVKGFLKRKWYCPHWDKYFDANRRTESECLDFVKDMCYAEFFRKEKFSEEFRGGFGPTIFSTEAAYGGLICPFSFLSKKTAMEMIEKFIMSNIFTS